MAEKSSSSSPARGQTGSIAVALKQAAAQTATDQSQSLAMPQITAKGRGAVAEQILQIAFASGVKVREDADLAETLEVLELGSDVPVAAISAIAEILTHAYRANGAAAPDSTHPPLPPRRSPLI